MQQAVMRPTLFACATQHVLALQEEDDTPPPQCPPHPLTARRAAAPAEHDASAASAAAPCFAAATTAASAADAAAAASASAEEAHPHVPWHDGLHAHAPPSPHRSSSPRNDPTPSSPASVSHAPLSSARRHVERVKTAHGALVLCLNIGVDPPDAVKPNPCARLQCWQTPNPDQPSKSINAIASTLKMQYERWQQKVRYRAAPDPTVTELKRVCVAMRRAAKEDRVLFHYNGHGVPRPTANGEIWVFNHNFSQYIPLNLLDLHDVLGSPALYIFDCNSAGTILAHFRKLCAQLDREWADAAKKTNRSLPTAPHRHSIMLAACKDDQDLPTNPALPADLFTSCLTTPIKTALRWMSNRTLIRDITPAMLDRIPGNVNARGTPLGELNYIFTTITDSIAWNVLPRDVFRRLYRQDHLLASLMRNFFFAQRVMRSYGCTPVSQPELPETHQHPLWQSFDLAVENLFAQLPALIAEEDARRRARDSSEEADPAAATGAGHLMQGGLPPISGGDVRSRAGGIRPTASLPTLATRSDDPASSAESAVSSSPSAIANAAPLSYRPSSFFEDQIKAFAIWLEMGPDDRDPPEQLPIMLQLLLSPGCRSKALPLFSRYMQTGPEAVDLALSVGIFPYVLRLLQNQSLEIRKDLVFIWAKIISNEESCREDLLKEKADEYFVRFLLTPDAGGRFPSAVYLACALYLISVIQRDQSDRCINFGAYEACFRHIVHANAFVRRWACMCLAQLVRGASEHGRLSALHWAELLERLRCCADGDRAADVRAAALGALAEIMNSVLGMITYAEPTPEQQQQAFVAAEVGKLSTSFFDETAVPTAPSSAVSPNFEEASPRLGEVAGAIARAPNGSPLGSGGEGALPEGMYGARLRRDGNVSTTSLTRMLEEDLESNEVIVPPYSDNERIALLSIGETFRHVTYKESSVLVRREVASAIAVAVRLQQERFVRAALITDVIGVGKSPETVAAPSTESICEDVYRGLWLCLSELAFDPHPIVAALARRAYDVVCELLVERTGGYNLAGSMGDVLPEGQLPFSSPEISTDNQVALAASHGTSSSSNGLSPTDSSILDGQTRVEFPSSPEGRSSDNETFQDPVGPATPTDFTVVGRDYTRGRRTPHTAPLVGSPASGRLPPTEPVHSTTPEGSPQERVVAGNIHVRSASGSFELTKSSRLPYLSKLPRVHSVSLFPSDLTGGATNGPSTTSPRDTDVVERSEPDPPERTPVPDDDGPKSLPHIALAKGVEILMKQVSQQFNLKRIGSGGAIQPAAPMRHQSARELHMEKEESDMGIVSPPRQRKRSMSYQVLNAASTLSPKGDAPPLFAPSKHTSYVPSSGGLGDVRKGAPTAQGKRPAGPNHKKFMSGIGHAALSLYEWSCIHMSRVECDRLVTDDAVGDDAIPRYATLWHNISKASGSMPIADSLRAFALLGKGDDVRGIDDPDCLDDVIGDDFSNAEELSLEFMGAGGGAVSAMTFLPRDTGIGDDQLVATGDSTGSVGVFDARTGKCHGAFGIPCPPGVPESGISSILCLNPPTGKTGAVSSVLPNSHTALLLAGAFDGRVAVFKSDFAGPNYRIMSTFQASGRSAWSKVRTAENRLGARHHHGLDAAVAAGTDGVDDMKRPQSLARILRESGNGLVIAFNSTAATLAAGGCDGEIVRVWDLEAERCCWESDGTLKGTWPTAISMWKGGNPNVFVVGCSNGAIQVVDMREGPLVRDMSGLRRLGTHREPIVSVGTCPPGSDSGPGEIIVSGDVGGEIAFWDPRWNGEDFWAGSTLDPEVSRIGAHSSHLTALSVHQTGRYIASGSPKCVKIFGADRTMLKMISHHERGERNVRGRCERIAAVTSLAFQHETSLLAVGCMDSSVMIYGRHRDLFPGIQTAV